MNRSGKGSNIPFLRHFPLFMVTFVVGLGVSTAVAGDDNKAANSLGPVIIHTPMVTAVRGVPVDITATITAQDGASITSKTVFVKVSDAGTPVKYLLTGTGDAGVYHAAIPVSLMKGISVFWYSITAADSGGRVKSTQWIRCVIIDPVEPSGGEGQGEVGIGGHSGGGSDAGGGAAAAGGSGGSLETTTFIVGGVLLAGGTAVILDNQGSSKKKSEPEPEPEPVPKKKKKKGGGSNESTPADPPCVTTGSESVTYENLSYYCDEGIFDILVLVCGTCPDATIMAMTSWGESDSISGYNNDLCDPQGQKLTLPLPILQGFSRVDINKFRENGGTGGAQFINPGDETITVYANGVQIDQIVWPPLSDNDCL